MLSPILHLARWNIDYCDKYIFYLIPSFFFFLPFLPPSRFRSYVCLSVHKCVRSRHWRNILAGGVFHFKILCHFYSSNRHIVFFFTFLRLISFSCFLLFPTPLLTPARVFVRLSCLNSLFLWVIIIESRTWLVRPSSILSCPPPSFLKQPINCSSIIFSWIVFHLKSLIHSRTDFWMWFTPLPLSYLSIYSHNVRVIDLFFSRLSKTPVVCGLMTRVGDRDYEWFVWFNGPYAFFLHLRCTCSSFIILAYPVPDIVRNQDLLPFL